MSHPSTCFSNRNRSADGDIDRDEYLQHKIEADNETERCEAMTTDAQRQFADLLMEMEVVNNQGSCLYSSRVEDKQVLTNTLFEVGRGILCCKIFY